jgi:hypothetical protein
MGERYDKFRVSGSAQVVSGTTGPDSAQVADRLIISFSPAVKR